MHAAPTRYTDGTNEFEGFLAFDGPISHRRPGVLVFHQWSGEGEFERSKAQLLADQGYVALAVDMYGAGKRGRSPAENGALMTPLVEDRALLRARTEAALAHLRRQPNVDTDRIGAIGFCFGGLCAYDLARYGVAGVRGVVGFHGLLGAPAAGQVARAERMHTKVLACHGWNDPMAKPDAVNAFAREMHDHGCDWQLHAFGGCGHAFTNPGAQDPKGGMQYNPLADRRAFQLMHDFFIEVFGEQYATKVTDCPWPG
jgi:dienelactone hydrolase